MLHADAILSGFCRATVASRFSRLGASVGIAPLPFPGCSMIWSVQTAMCDIQDEPAKLGDQFARLQTGMVMLSTHRSQYIVDTMEEWRKTKTRELHKKGLGLHSAKRALVAVRLRHLAFAGRTRCSRPSVRPYTPERMEAFQASQL
jgi:hypothetical protein